MDSVEVSEQVHAPADRVWDLIGDPTRMADLTAECTMMAWAGGATAPEVGARFRGSNRLGWRRWTTTCTIVDHQPGRSIAWDVHAGPFAVARWSYRIEPGAGDGAATTVTERFEDHRTPAFRAIGPLLRGVSDPVAHNRQNMAETLARLKRRAEG